MCMPRMKYNVVTSAVLWQLPLFLYLQKLCPCHRLSLIAHFIINCFTKSLPLRFILQYVFCLDSLGIGVWFLAGANIFPVFSSVQCCNCPWVPLRLTVSQHHELLIWCIVKHVDDCSLPPLLYLCFTFHSINMISVVIHVFIVIHVENVLSFYCVFIALFVL